MDFSYTEDDVKETREGNEAKQDSGGNKTEDELSSELKFVKDKILDVVGRYLLETRKQDRDGNLRIFDVKEIRKGDETKEKSMVGATTCYFGPEKVSGSSKKEDEVSKQECSNKTEVDLKLLLQDLRQRKVKLDVVQRFLVETWKLPPDLIREIFDVNETGKGDEAKQKSVAGASTCYFEKNSGSSKKEDEFSKQEFSIEAESGLKLLLPDLSGRKVEDDILDEVRPAVDEIRKQECEAKSELELISREQNVDSDDDVVQDEESEEEDWKKGKTKEEQFQLLLNSFEHKHLYEAEKEDLSSVDEFGRHDITYREWLWYNFEVNESGGFEVGIYPDVFSCGMIVPYKLKLDEHHDELISYAQKAIDKYNKKKKTNYADVKILKVNRAAVGGTMYYITFEVSNNDGARVFQTKVFEEPGGGNPEIEICLVRPSRISK